MSSPNSCLICGMTLQKGIFRRMVFTKQMKLIKILFSSIFAYCFSSQSIIRAIINYSLKFISNSPGRHTGLSYNMHQVFSHSSSKYSLCSSYCGFSSKINKCIVALLYIFTFKKFSPWYNLF